MSPSLQVVPLGRFGCKQIPPPLQWSLVQSFPSSVQVVPFGSKLLRHDPEPLQVSGLSQSLLNWVLLPKSY